MTILAGDLVNAGFSATAFLPIIGDAAEAVIQNAGSKVGSQAAGLLAKYGDDVAKWADDALGIARKKELELANMVFLNLEQNHLKNIQIWHIGLVEKNLIVLLS